MIVVYTGENPPKSFSSSIFLAGPSPRTKDGPNWRPKAIEILEELGYKGVVFDPTWREEPASDFDYDKQVEWERKSLNSSDIIVFWVPRDLKKLPGFTTNVEFGLWVKSGKVVLGSPPGAEKMSYLEWWAEQEGVENFHDLRKLLESVVRKLNGGAERTGGEREIPLHLWRKAEFKTWLNSQKGVGNRIDGAEVVWTFRVGKNRVPFLWALHVNVWIASEGRNKTNEVVVFRSDISAIIAYCLNGPDVLDAEIAFIREFRSPANNPDAMVYEVPSGSGVRGDAAITAAEEMREETGLSIEAERFWYLGTRQLAATLSAHRSHVFAVELTPSEMLDLKWRRDEPLGNEEDSERTYVEVMTVREMLANPSIDWSNFGMVFQALHHVANIE